MPNLRPGLGSCTANWGTHDDHVFETCMWGNDPDGLAAAHVGPRSVGLAPRLATEEPTSNPKESVLDCTNKIGQRRKDCCGPTTE